MHGSLSTVRIAAKEYGKVRYPRTIIDKMASDFGWSTTLFDKFDTKGSSHRMFLFEKKL